MSDNILPDEISSLMAAQLLLGERILSNDISIEDRAAMLAAMLGEDDFGQRENANASPAGRPIGTTNADNVERTQSRCNEVPSISAAAASSSSAAAFNSTSSGNGRETSSDDCKSSSSSDDDSDNANGAQNGGGNRSSHRENKKKHWKKNRKTEIRKNEKTLDDFVNELIADNPSSSNNGIMVPIDRDELLAMVNKVCDAAEQMNHWQNGDIDAFANKFRQEATKERAEVEARAARNEAGQGAEREGTATAAAAAKAAWAASEEYRRRMRNPRLIAAVARANFLATGNNPRMAQIVALLVLGPRDQSSNGRLIDQSSNGRLIQCATGEGKTTITAMHAAMLALSDGIKGKVDIITSCKPLAVRDCRDKKRRSFYTMLGLKVAHNTAQLKKPEYRKAYDADIVYGDLGSFQGDMLREYTGVKVRGDRPYSNIIVDEADCMLVDDVTSSRILMLSHDIPWAEHLHSLMEMGWTHWNLTIEPLLSRIVLEPDELERGPYVLAVTNPGTGELKKEYFNDPDAFFRDVMVSYFHDMIDGKIEDVDVPIPRHLKELAKKMSHKWPSSIKTAIAMVKGKNYTIKIDAMGNERVKIVDYTNTGTVQMNMRWSAGLHEFLEIKEHVKMSREGMVALFSSNLEYIRRYGTNIYGLTGTLGSNETQAFLTRLFPVKLAKIPTYKEKRFTQLSGLMLNTRSEWMDTIVQVVMENVGKGRAILVINQTMNIANEVNDEVRQKMDRHEALRIRLYTDDQLHENAVEEAVEPGDLILSTNLCGRGTDIQTTEAVDANGGLLVLITFLPPNLRVQEQAFGRTSRQGKPGMGQMILCRRNDKDSLCFPLDSNFDDVINSRNENAKLALEEFERDELPKMELRDKMFAKFSAFILELLRDADMQKELVLFKQMAEQCAEVFWDVEDLLDGPYRGINEAECMQKVEALIQSLRQTIAKNKEQARMGQFCVNPTYKVKQAQQNLGRNRHIGEATEQLLAEVVREDPRFSAPANITRAWNHAAECEADLIQNNSFDAEVHRARHNAMRQHLEDTIKTVEDTATRIAAEQMAERGMAAEVEHQQQQHQNRSTGTASTSGNSTNGIGQQQRQAGSLESGSVQQRQTRIDLLRAIQRFLEKQIETINNIPSGQTIRVERLVDINELIGPRNDSNSRATGGNTDRASGAAAKDDREDDGEDDAEDDAKDDAEEVQDLRDQGFILTKFGHAKKKTPWWSVFALIVLGVVQVGLGVVAACSGNLPLATTLFKEGFKDFTKAIKVAMGEDTIDWNQYWVDKAVTYSGAMVFSFGRHLATKFFALKEFIQWLINQDRVSDATTIDISQLIDGALKKDQVKKTFGKLNQSNRKNKDQNDRREWAIKQVQAQATNRIMQHKQLHNEISQLLAYDASRDSLIRIMGTDISRTQSLAEIRQFCANLNRQIANGPVQSINGTTQLLDTWLERIVARAKEVIKAIELQKAVHSTICHILKGMQKDEQNAQAIVDKLCQHGILLCDGHIWASDAVEKLQHCQLGQFEHVRSGLQYRLKEIRGLFDAKEGEAKLVEGKLVEALLNLVKMELDQSQEHFGTDPEDLRNLNNAFR